MYNAACGEFVTWDEVPIKWSFSCTFEEVFKDTIRDAAEYWNQIVGQEVFVESDECSTGLSVEAEFEVDSNVIAVVTYAAKCELPVSRWRWIMVYFSEWFTTDDVIRLKVARHEFGHALGLDHSADTECLMFPTIFDYKVRACEQELLEVKRVYGH